MAVKPPPACREVSVLPSAFTVVSAEGGNASAEAPVAVSPAAPRLRQYGASGGSTRWEQRSRGVGAALSRTISHAAGVGPSGGVVEGES
ncbi:MAG: hypothetical protein WHU94_09860 [Thermogemmata sp.]